MLRAFVVHWDEAELPAKQAAVEAAGGRVVGGEAEDGARAVRRVRELAADVLVVWLSRRPGHGRATAGAVRAAAWGRGLPILFVDGDPDPLPKDRRRALEQAVPDGLLATPATLPAWLRKVEDAIAVRARPAA